MTLDVYENVSPDPSAKVEFTEPTFMHHGCNLVQPEMWGCDVEHKDTSLVNLAHDSLDACSITRDPSSIVRPTFHPHACSYTRRPIFPSCMCTINLRSP